MDWMESYLIFLSQLFLFAALGRPQSTNIHDGCVRSLPRRWLPPALGHSLTQRSSLTVTRMFLTPGSPPYPVHSCVLTTIRSSCVLHAYNSHSHSIHDCLKKNKADFASAPKYTTKGRHSHWLKKSKRYSTQGRREDGASARYDLKPCLMLSSCPRPFFKSYSFRKLYFHSAQLLLHEKLKKTACFKLALESYQCSDLCYYQAKIVTSPLQEIFKQRIKILSEPEFHHLSFPFLPSHSDSHAHTSIFLGNNG